MRLSDAISMFTAVYSKQLAAKQFNHLQDRVKKFFVQYSVITSTYNERG